MRRNTFFIALLIAAIALFLSGAVHAQDFSTEANLIKETRYGNCLWETTDQATMAMNYAVMDFCDARNPNGESVVPMPHHLIWELLGKFLSMVMLIIIPFSGIFLFLEIGQKDNNQARVEAVRFGAIALVSYLLMSIAHPRYEYMNIGGSLAGQHIHNSLSLANYASKKYMHALYSGDVEHVGIEIPPVIVGHHLAMTESLTCAASLVTNNNNTLATYTKESGDKGSISIGESFSRIGSDVKELSFGSEAECGTFSFEEAGQALSAVNMAISADGDEDVFSDVSEAAKDVMNEQYLAQLDRIVAYFARANELIHGGELSGVIARRAGYEAMISDSFGSFMSKELNKKDVDAVTERLQNAIVSEYGKSVDAFMSGLRTNMQSVYVNLNDANKVKRDETINNTNFFMFPTNIQAADTLTVQASGFIKQNTPVFAAGTSRCNAVDSRGGDWSGNTSNFYNKVSNEMCVEAYEIEDRKAAIRYIHTKYLESSEIGKGEFSDFVCEAGGCTESEVKGKINKKIHAITMRAVNDFVRNSSALKFLGIEGQDSGGLDQANIMNWRADLYNMGYGLFLGVTAALASYYGVSVAGGVVGKVANVGLSLIPVVGPALGKGAEMLAGGVTSAIRGVAPLVYTALGALLVVSVGFTIVIPNLPQFFMVFAVVILSYRFIAYIIAVFMFLFRNVIKEGAGIFGSRLEHQIKVFFATLTRPTTIVMGIAIVNFFIGIGVLLSLMAMAGVMQATPTLFTSMILVVAGFVLVFIFIYKLSVYITVRGMFIGDDADELTGNTAFNTRSAGDVAQGVGEGMTQGAEKYTKSAMGSAKGAITSSADKAYDASKSKASGEVHRNSSTAAGFMR